ncbi:MAG: hypothetical protein WCF10_13885, partial [Polyangiales bacterium]
KQRADRLSSNPHCVLLCENAVRAVPMEHGRARERNREKRAAAASKIGVFRMTCETPHKAWAILP